MAPGKPMDAPHKFPTGIHTTIDVSRQSGAGGCATLLLPRTPWPSSVMTGSVGLDTSPMDTSLMMDALLVYRTDTQAIFGVSRGFGVGPCAISIPRTTQWLLSVMTGSAFMMSLISPSGMAPSKPMDAPHKFPTGIHTTIDVSRQSGAGGCATLLLPQTPWPSSVMTGSVGLGTSPMDKSLMMDALLVYRTDTQATFGVSRGFGEAPCAISIPKTTQWLFSVMTGSAFMMSLISPSGMAPGKPMDAPHKFHTGIHTTIDVSRQSGVGGCATLLLPRTPWPSSVMTG